MSNQSNQQLFAETGSDRLILGVGEAMVELASIGQDTYQRGFAGDTLNTCWHMARLLGSRARVGYCTRVGTDDFSDQFLDFLSSGGIDTTRIDRDPERTLGLYVITLKDAERHFAYWRDTSAARRLADDAARLAEVTRGAALIHVSGITLAIIGERGRDHLTEALAKARMSGAKVSFDPNVRMRLWRDAAEVRRAVQGVLEVVDIALPSFDDEAALWGDADPQATVSRLETAGVGEVVVKDGPKEVCYSLEGLRGKVSTAPVERVIDTTGAGDAFNAGYLSARISGADCVSACRVGQRLAGVVLGYYGALVPDSGLDPLRSMMQELENANQRGV